MLGRRDLGFLSPVFLVVAVFVVVIVLVLRRKWRQSVARSEEVRRLLISASEEASRVEFEAREAYYYTATATPSDRVSVSTPSYGSVPFGSPLKPQYQCAVCFCPTTTRCAKCKAVRYCSGKCQIVHWRQGHKDECRPYVAVTQSNNVGGSSSRQGDHNEHIDSFDTEPKQTATPAELKSPSSYEGHSVLSTPTSFSAGVTFENLETVKLAHGTPVNTARKSTGFRDNNLKTSKPSNEDTYSGTSSSCFWTDDGSNESSLSETSTTSFGFWDGNIPKKKSSINEHDDSAPGTVGKAEYVQLANHTSKAPVNTARKSTGIRDNNLKTSNLSGEDTHSGTSSSFFWTDDGSNESSLSETSTTSFGFWDGNIPKKKSSIKEHDDSAPGTVGKAEYVQLANHTSKVVSNSIIMDEFCAAKVIDGPGLRSKKSNDITNLSKGIINDGSNSTRPPTCTSGMLNHRDGSADSDLPTFKFTDSKLSSSDVPFHRASTAAMFPKVTEKSDDILCNKNMAHDMSKSRDVASSSIRASDTYKTTVTSTNISHRTKHVKVINDDSHRIAACSSQLTEASKFRDSENSLSDVSSHRASAAARYSTVPEKSNDVFCNKSTTPDMSKSRDVVSSSPRASDTNLTTVTSRNTSHGTKPVKVVNDHSRGITTTTSQLTASRSGSRTSKSKVVDYLKPSKLSHQESLEGGSDPTHRYSFKGLFPYEMFVKLYNWKQVELQPCGFKNCGNSCYANAVLQCLIYTPPLTAYLLEGLHSKACEKRGWCFTCEFEGLVMKAKGGSSPLSPIRILTHIENIGSSLGHGKEEDAHEFLRYVIDALQSVCIKESRKKSLNAIEEETTLIGLTFGGYLRSKIICMKCGGKSEQNERMLDLTVEIEGDIRTLEEALGKFTHTEILDGENKYKCDRCKSYEKAKKKLTLLEAPNVLTIALKRFQSGKFGKLNKSIHFPDILDMAPYVSGTSDKSPIYSLYGVVVHVDTMNAAFSGHYVCYVKNLKNQWFKFDDSMVKEVDLQHVLTKGAYMLLYARCSPRAPRSIRSSIINDHHDPRRHKTLPSSASKSHSIAPWDTCTYHPPHHHRSLEEESFSSDNSGFFSESCSCSTDSTLRDSSSVEDHISGDWEPDYNRNINLNSSDSDTSSSSSFPSPLYSRLSQLYTSTTNGEDNHKVSKVCRNLDCSCNSCRITNLDRLGERATYPTSKPSVTFRKSASRGKSD